MPLKNFNIENIVGKGRIAHIDRNWITNFNDSTVFELYYYSCNKTLTDETVIGYELCLDNWHLCLSLIQQICSRRLWRYLGKHTEKCINVCKITETSWNHFCGKRRNCLFWAILTFVTIFFKSHLLQRYQKIWERALNTAALVIISYCLRFYATFNKFFIYTSISWVIYQCYWSIYPDTSQFVIMLTQQPWTPRRAAITTIFVSPSVAW